MTILIYEDATLDGMTCIIKIQEKALVAPDTKSKNG